MIELEPNGFHVIVTFKLFFFFFFRLLHSQNVNCQYKDAEETYNKALKICTELEGRGHKVNKAVLYAEHCALLFAQSRYTQVMALAVLSPSVI